MYEEYVVLERDVFDDVFWKGEFEKKLVSVFDYGIQELDVVRTFNGDEPEFFFLSGTGRELDSPEVWRLGKKAFDSINKIVRGGIESKGDIEKLCYLSIVNFLVPAKKEYLEGNYFFVGEDGVPIDFDEFKGMSGAEVAVNCMAKAWEMAEEPERGMIEMGINAFIIHAIDGLVISWLMDDWGVGDFYWASALSNKLNEWCLVRSKSAEHASKAAKARHAETEWIKEEVFKYYDAHRHEFKSLRAAAKEIEKREPVKFRTIYDWLRHREQT